MKLIIIILLFEYKFVCVPRSKRRFTETCQGVQRIPLHLREDYSNLQNIINSYFRWNGHIC